MLERRERGAVLGPDPVAHHARHVAAERQRQFLHVGHHLGVRALQARMLVPGLLQLDDAQRQPVDIQNDVEPALVITIDDHDLVGGQEVVRVRVGVVDQPDRRVVLRAMLVGVDDAADAVSQVLVDLMVLAPGITRFRRQHDLHRFLNG